MTKEKYTYEVRQIDAWWYDDGWTMNDSWKLGEFQTSAKSHKRAFVRYLNKKGISFKLNRTLVEYDGDCYEVVDRKTKEPLFIAIPILQF